MAAPKWLRRSGKVLGYGLLGLLGLLIALVVWLQTAWARSVLSGQVTAALAEQFKGTLTIERMGGLGLFGVSGTDVRMRDSAGRTVLLARGVSVRLGVPTLVRRLIAGGPALRVDLASVTCASADVGLFQEPDGSFSIANAFLPRTVTPPSAEESEFELQAPHLEFAHVWLHGQAGEGLPVDAELDRLDASFAYVSDAYDSVLLDLRGTELKTRALPEGANPEGTLRASLSVPSTEEGPTVWAEFDGKVLGAPSYVSASLRDQQLLAYVEVSEVAAQVIEERVSGVAPRGATSLRLSAEGTLTELQVRGDVEGAAGIASLDASLALAPVVHGHAALVARGIDASAVVPSAPATHVSLSAESAFSLAENAEPQNYRIVIEPGRVAGETTPAVAASGTWALAAGGAMKSSGKIAAREPGATVRVDYTFDAPAGKAGKVAFDVAAELAEAARLARYGVHGRGRVGARGSFDIGSSIATARVEADLRNITVSNVPELRGFRADRIEARSELRYAEALELSNSQVTLRLPEALFTLKAERARIGDGLVVKGFAFDGAGAITADINSSAGRTELDLKTDGLDLARLGRSARMDLPVQSAFIDVSAHYEERGGVMNGSVKGTIRDVSLKQFEGLNGKADLDLSLEQRRLSGSAKVEAGRFGALAFEATELEIPTALTRERLEHVRGELHAKGNLDIARLSEVIPPELLPIERSSGKVEFELSRKPLNESHGEAWLSARLETHALRLVQKREHRGAITTTAQAKAADPFAIEGIDFEVALELLAAAKARASLIATDHIGVLVQASAELTLPRGSFAELPSVLPSTRLEAALLVPSRSLATLPAVVRPLGVQGNASVYATLKGSIDAPDVFVGANVSGLRTLDARRPLDLEATFKYAQRGGELNAHAASKGAPAALELQSAWQGDLLSLAETGAGPPKITAHARAKLREFPLGVVPQLADNQLRGRLSADFQLDDWGRDAALSLDLSSNKLFLNRVPVDELKVKSSIKQNQLVAELGMKAGGGSVTGKLVAAMTWGAQLAPTLGHRANGEVTARGFKLETLLPLVASQVSELGGKLDASARIAITEQKTEVSGDATLERGVLQIPAVGQRFSNIGAKVVVAGDEARLVSLEAHGTSGRVTAKGKARLDGFAVRSAEATVDIPKREKLPLTIEGAEIGEASGHIDLKYAADLEQPADVLTVSVPSFEIVIPESGGQGLQSLDPDPDVRVGVRQSDGRFATIAVQPLDPGGEEKAPTASRPLVVKVELGRDVVVKRGLSVNAQIGGQIAVTPDPAGKSHVTGRIEIKGGKLDVQGKTFEVERGVVTFDGGDPSNPTITATARWDSPSNYSVYADYIGDVKTGKIKLRSEPPLSQDEIVSLLLFGTPDGSVGSGGDSSTAAVAVSVAGETAAKGLNRALSDFTSLEVSARIDTSTGSARPELMVQLSPRVSAKLTRAIGEPNGTQPPDMTFFTLEFRLKRAWALSTVFGDRGASAIDLIWRKRY